MYVIAVVTVLLDHFYLVSQKTHLAAVFDCRTIIVGYYNNIIIIQLASAYKIYRQFLPYWADRSARYGKGRLYCMCVLYLHRIDSRKALVAKIAIEWLPCRSILRDKLWIISKLKVKIKNPADHSSSFVPFCMPI